uniref:lipase maturation factor 1 isoform X2 n=1 Tax=Myxine glutinosa TaxID=7769 RepID=UPI00358E9A0F
MSHLALTRVEDPAPTPFPHLNLNTAADARNHSPDHTGSAAWSSCARLPLYTQNKALLGQNGLLPANQYLQRVRDYVGDGVGWATLRYSPTLLWFFDYEHSINWSLDFIAVLGLVLSSFVLLTGRANMPLMATLWVLYHSLVNVGQVWYSFGWESQLLETGFLAIFMCPLMSLQLLPCNTPPPAMVIWAYRWLIFRIMLGAGLIKLRGDKCWHDLTCMKYHYETQPVPNPLAYFMHQTPMWFHNFEVLVNHFIELVVPFFLLLGRRMRIAHGLLQILFQVLLILSGNLSFLNWVTIVPCIASFDDPVLAPLFSTATRTAAAQVQAKHKGQHPGFWCRVRQGLHLALGLLIAYLSIPVIQNLLSARQHMNTSFDPLRIVNTYGAFGTVTKERTEVILQGTASADPKGVSVVWEEYEFKCKPGSLKRRPCLISPYHYRLDWLMWFAAFQTYEQNEWLVHLVGKLLINDNATLDLMDHNPFHGRYPPRWVRAEHFRYQFSHPGRKNAATGKWWIRKRIGGYLPPVNLEILAPYFRSHGWNLPERL